MRALDRAIPIPPTTKRRPRKKSKPLAPKESRSAKASSFRSRQGLEFDGPLENWWLDDPYFRLGHRAGVLKELIAKLEPLTGWTATATNQEDRWSALYRGEIHSDLARFYERNLAVLEQAQFLYPSRSIQRAWHPHMPVRRSRQPPFDFSTPTDFTQYHRYGNEQPFGNPLLPIPLALRCQLLCNTCVGKAITYARTVLLAQRTDRIAAWNELNRHEQDILEAFIQFERSKPGVARGRGEIATKVGISLNNPRFKEALRSLASTKFGILKHEGSVDHRGRRLGKYRLMNLPRNLPPHIAGLASWQQALTVSDD